MPKCLLTKSVNTVIHLYCRVTQSLSFSSAVRTSHLFIPFQRKRVEELYIFLYVFPLFVSLFIIYLIQINDSAEKICCHLCTTNLVSNKGSQSTWYALIVPHIWMLAWRWSDKTEMCCHSNTNICTQLLCFGGNLKHFVLLLNPFRFNYSSLACNALILEKISKGNIIIWHSMLCLVMKRTSFCTQVQFYYFLWMW